MDNGNLLAAVRALRGKNAMRRLRTNGRVPANFYGPHYETMALDLDAKLLDNALAHRRPIYKLEIADKGNFEVILREVQRDPVSDKVLHIDLYGITRGQKITVTIPVKITGIPIGVRTGGGILEILRRHLDIECLPKDIPEYIELDVNDIEVGESRHVSDLKLENVSILLDQKSTIAAVVPPTVAKVIAEVTAEAEETAEGEAAEEKKAEPAKE